MRRERPSKFSTSSPAPSPGRITIRPKEIEHELGLCPPWHAVTWRRRLPLRLFALFEVYPPHSLASMKYHQLILTLAVSLALPTIAVAKEKATDANLEATLKKIEQEIVDAILKSHTS